MDKIDPSSNEEMKVFTTEDTAFALVDNVELRFEEVLEEILGYSNWGDKFSEKYVENAIRDLINNVQKEGDKESVQDRVATLFDQLIDNFDRYSTEHIIYLPLEGLDMPESAWPNDEVSIGNIVLRKTTDARIEEILNTFESSMSESRNLPGTIESMLETARARLDE